MDMELQKIIQAHARRYPLMGPADYGKLAYQSEYGPEHLIADPAQVLPRLLAEWETARHAAAQPPEAIGNGLCRFHLTSAYPPHVAAPLLAELFLRTARSHTGTQKGLAMRLAALRPLPVPGMRAWLEEYEACGCPPLSHSEAFRAAYAPHYRVLRLDDAGFFPALLAVAPFVEAGEPAIIAIDGPCGSGKTGLAALLAALFPCNVVHTDDFYLPLAHRKRDWQKIPAGNMDLARLQREVLLPLRQGKPALYRPYSCQTDSFGPPCTLPPRSLTIVEGSYSLHPLVTDAYSLKLFLTCPPETQARRLQAREGAAFEAFRTLWIPLEERYLRECRVAERCDLSLDTGDFF